MGHERVGILPKSKKWREIVIDIVDFDSDKPEITPIVQKTLEGVRNQFDNLQYDKSVFEIFKFLILLSISGKRENQKEFLSSLDINIPKNQSALGLAKSLNKYLESQGVNSKEFESLAKSSAFDTIADWYEKSSTNQFLLFDKQNISDVWSTAADGRGFCELSRIYFSNLVERYLKYFVEREASSKMPFFKDRNSLNSQLEKHIDQISKHAFETTKITQSYSAGWFNKHTKDKVPSDRLIKNYIGYSLGKIKGELLRESEK